MNLLKREEDGLQDEDASGSIAVREKVGGPISRTIIRDVIKKLPRELWAYSNEFI